MYHVSKKRDQQTQQTTRWKNDKLVQWKKDRLAQWKLEVDELRIRVLELEQQDPHHPNLKHLNTAVLRREQQIKDHSDKWDITQYNKETPAVTRPAESREECTLADQRFPDRPCGHRFGSIVRPCCRGVLEPR
jgi:hypothetical protein